MFRFFKDLFDFRTPLMLISQGDTEALDERLRNGSLSLDYRFISGTTLLGHAIEINQQDSNDYDCACKAIVWMLLAGIDINIKRATKDKIGIFIEEKDLVIYSIFSAYNEPLLKLLISAGGDFTKINHYRNPKISFAKENSSILQKPLTLEKLAIDKADEENFPEAIKLLETAISELEKRTREEELKLENQTEKTPLSECSHKALVHYYKTRIERLTHKINTYQELQYKPENSQYLTNKKMN